MIKIDLSNKAQIICIWAFLLALLWGCANVVTPSGGPKDQTPPKVIDSSPSEGQTNFKGNEIVLSFNEFFKLNNPSQEIYFSPPLSEKPEYNIRQKSLQIQLPEEGLKDSTTYTITFGKGIKDITEGNAAKDLIRTFSTGPTMDTCQLAGKVVDAFTREPKKNVWVSLYQTLDDSVPDERRPQYVTKTDENGQYRFDHLPKSSFYIFALKDNNSNLRYDLPNEEMAFRLPTVKAVKSDSIPKTTLRLFQKEPPRISRVSSTTPVKGKLVINYSKEIQTFSHRFVNPDFGNRISIRHESTLPSDSVALWFNPIPDSACQLITTANDTVADTIAVEFSKRKALRHKLAIDKQKQQRGGKKKINWSSHKVYKPYVLSFSFPIDTILKNRIQIFEDSTDRIADTAFSIEKSGLRQLAIQQHWDDTSRYFLKLEKGAIRSIYNQPSDTITKYFRTTKQEDYSKITLQFDNAKPANDYIAQLYKGEDNVQREMNFQSDQQDQLTIQHLRPETYKLRIIVDENKNGKWDPGNFSRKQQPEPVIYYEGEIEVRRNWENEVKVEL